jgi:hypothetical protein
VAIVEEMRSELDRIRVQFPNGYAAPAASGGPVQDQCGEGKT